MMMANATGSMNGRSIKNVRAKAPASSSVKKTRVAFFPFTSEPPRLIAMQRNTSIFACPAS